MTFRSDFMRGFAAASAALNGDDPQQLRARDPEHRPGTTAEPEAVHDACHGAAAPGPGVVAVSSTGARTAARGPRACGDL